MNMDDVEREFWGDQREQPTRVRLARVIRSLRDQFDFTSRGKNWSEGEVHDFFTEILGGLDAEGKAAGGFTREDGKAVEAAGDKGPVYVNSSAADVCTWSHPKPGPEGQLVEYKQSTCGNPKWASGYPKWVDGYFVNKCQCGRPIYVDLQDPANAWLMESRA